MFRRFGAHLTIVLATLSVTNVPPAAAPRYAPALLARLPHPNAPHLNAPNAPHSAVLHPAIPQPTPARGTTRAAVARIVDVGHRGGKAYAPENTIAAFREGATRHADVVEFDVRQTKDDKLIIMHDSTLARTTDVEKIFPKRSPWRVGDFTLKEIKRLDAGSWFAARYKGEPVPTLDETLRALDGTGLGLLLEVKDPARYPGIGARVIADLRAHSDWLTPGRLIVQSFDWGFMKSLHAKLPLATTALLGTPSIRELASVRTYADLVNPTQGDVTQTYVAHAHAQGLRVYPWTVDDPAEMRRLMADKVDGIISNRPDVLRRVLDGQAVTAAAADARD